MAQRRATRLRADPAARAVIAAAIEQTAAADATALLTLTRYVPPLTTSARRDAYCSANLR